MRLPCQSFSVCLSPKLSITHEASVHRSNNQGVILKYRTGAFITFGTAAAVKLLDELGANIIGISVLIELGFLKGRAKLAPHPVSAILCY